MQCALAILTSEFLKRMNGDLMQSFQSTNGRVAGVKTCAYWIQLFGRGVTGSAVYGFHMSSQLSWLFIPPPPRLPDIQKINGICEPRRAILCWLEFASMSAFDHRLVLPSSDRSPDVSFNFPKGLRSRHWKTALHIYQMMVIICLLSHWRRKSNQNSFIQ